MSTLSVPVPVAATTTRPAKVFKGAHMSYRHRKRQEMPQVGQIWLRLAITLTYRLQKLLLN